MKGWRAKVRLTFASVRWDAAGTAANHSVSALRDSFAAELVDSLSKRCLPTQIKQSANDEDFTEGTHGRLPIKSRSGWQSVIR